MRADAGKALPGCMLAWGRCWEGIPRMYASMGKLMANSITILFEFSFHDFFQLQNQTLIFEYLFSS